MNKYTFQDISKAGKLGLIAASYGHPSTCPDSCPMKNSGCFAESGLNTRGAWRRTLSPNALSLEQLEYRIKALPRGHKYRYAVAGDLPGEGDNIDANALASLADATRKLVAWTYTHKPLMHGDNLAAVHDAIGRGFAINVSCETFDQVDNAIGLGLPAVMVGDIAWTNPRNAPKQTQNGTRLVVCPASVDGSSITCATCGGSKGPICARSEREFAVIFPAHGVHAKQAQQARNGERGDTGMRRKLEVIQ